MEQLYLKQIDQLKNNDVILYYYDDLNVFQLCYEDKKFILSRSGQLPSELRQWKAMQFELTKSYNNVDDFWSEFVTNEKWYVRFNFLNRYELLSSKVLVLAKHVISFFNDLRREHNFTYAEYNNINNWSNLVWSEEYKPTELKQWCSNCFKEVYYQVRYPKCICGDCYSKNK